MTRTLLIASAAIVALASFSAPSPAEAKRMCQKVTAKAMGLTEKGATGRAEKKLNRYVDRWTKKAGKTTVRISRISTSCEAGKVKAVKKCTAKAKACI